MRGDGGLCHFIVRLPAGLKNYHQPSLTTLSDALTFIKPAVRGSRENRKLQYHLKKYFSLLNNNYRTSDVSYSHLRQM